ncbi:MAG: rhodanese-like domain-containing protein [Rhizobiaceae bacterium]|nr:rhodanese-like domain-containing protein [Rhizobiaceae bacterium]
MTKIGVKELVERANEQVTTLSPENALEGQQQGQMLLVDIRDVRELDREGRVENAVHAPRGMLEFWFDAESPYHREVFAEENQTYVLFCAAGWRSALAAKSLMDMGFENIAHIDGGFGAMKDAGATLVEKKSS